MRDTTLKLHPLPADQEPPTDPVARELAALDVAVETFRSRVGVAPTRPTTTKSGIRLRVLPLHEARKG
jgi:hypothetical protein